MKQLVDKKVAVLGLGIEGIALANFLSGKVASVTVFDQKSEFELEQSTEENLLPSLKQILDNGKISKKLGSNIEDLSVSEFDIIFRSPSVYFNHTKLIEARERGIIVSSQIKLFMELCPCKIVGVTGTKGKGTTASLITKILAEETRNKKQETKRQIYLAGNIGYPAISLIPQLTADDIVVLELSNFQLADFDRSPQIVVFTNLGIDHLDYHNDVDEYREAKFNILKYQTEDDYAVLNLDSTYPKEKLSNIKSKKIFFTKNITSTADCGAGVRKNDQGLNEVVLMKSNIWEKICDERGIKLSGRHNLENIAAASIVADILDVDLPEIRLAVKEFVGLHYRLEFIKEIDGVKFFNDSFATNPGPTMAAVDSFDENKIMILGGSSKNADFSELANKISKTNVTAIILLGVEAARIELSLRTAGCKAKIFTGFSDLRQAVLQAKNIAVKGDIVIFSPACASFDMFKNYKDRGEKFNQIVDNLEDSK